MKKPGRFGPGLLVAAAFIGPGTVTTASLAGATFGYALLWVVLFSIVTTMVLQEMAARVGVVTGRGLGEAIRGFSSTPSVRILAATAVIASIGLGNAAFQAGNVLGAAAGLESLTGVPQAQWAIVVGLLAGGLLLFGGYQSIEKSLACLVGVMSLAFILTAILVRPPLGEVVSACVRPTLPSNSLVIVIALIGTTVVPYNLFLHASAVGEKWPTTVEANVRLRWARLDLVIAVAVGGLVTLAIVVTAAVAFHARGIIPKNAAALADQLEPLLGSSSKHLFAAGLAVAGVTSALTAPLAAAYATAGVLGWKPSMQTWRFRLVWMLILAAGTGAAIVGHKPLTMILWAQAANGVLLPVVAVTLLVVVNSKKMLANYRNGPAANLMGLTVIGVAAGLGIWNLFKALRALTG